MRVKVKRVGNHSLPLPKYETEGAAAVDLRASLDGHPLARLMKHPHSGERELCVMLGPDDHAYFPVGFAFEVPAGYELQVRPRSGLAFRHQVVAWHPIGTVDSDYRGEVQAALHNRGTHSFIVWHGDRIAQGVIAPVVRAELVEAEELSETARGGNGFGSTGST